MSGTWIGGPSEWRKQVSDLKGKILQGFPSAGPVPLQQPLDLQRQLLRAASAPSTHIYFLGNKSSIQIMD